MQQIDKCFWKHWLYILKLSFARPFRFLYFKRFLSPLFIITKLIGQAILVLKLVDVAKHADSVKGDADS